MAIETRLPLVDDILRPYEAMIGGDFTAYRNHVYRVVNLCFALGPFSGIEREKIQIAASFHDIGIWTAGTLDYLPPSEMAASGYLKAAGKADWTAEITEMIAMHHRVSACNDAAYPLVEVFRRADIADFSLGAVAMGISRDVLQQVKSAFPNAGFHRRLLQLGTRWLLRHPLNPLPMFRR